MTTSVALMGHGFPAQQAEQLGNDPVSVTCVGTAQAGAGKILATMVELITASGQTAAILPLTNPGTPYYIFNKNSDSGLVYAPVGATVNGNASASTPLTVAQNKGAIMWQYKRNFWTYVLLA